MQEPAKWKCVEIICICSSLKCVEMLKRKWQKERSGAGSGPFTRPSCPNALTTTIYGLINHIAKSAFIICSKVMLILGTGFGRTLHLSRTELAVIYFIAAIVYWPPLGCKAFNQQKTTRFWSNDGWLIIEKKLMNCRKTQIKRTPYPKLIGV